MAHEARQQAEKTAARAKDAAEAAVPKRGKSKKSKDHKKDGHKDGHKKDKAQKDKSEKAEKAKDTDEAVSETKTAPKKAS